MFFFDLEDTSLVPLPRQMSFLVAASKMSTVKLFTSSGTTWVNAVSEAASPSPTPTGIAVGGYSRSRVTT
jgi:hypothetical protein